MSTPIRRLEGITYWIDGSMRKQSKYIRRGKKRPTIAIGMIFRHLSRRTKQRRLGSVMDKTNVENFLEEIAPLYYS